MSNGEKTGVEGTETNGTEKGKEETKTVPLSALVTERAETARLKAELAALTTAQTTAAEKAAAEAGEHRKLYEALKPQHDALAGKLADYEKRETARVEALTARNTAKAAALPDAAKKLVPAGMDADTLAAWLETAAEAFAEEPVAKGTQRGTRTGEPPIPAECTAHFEKYGKHLGITERDYYTHTWLPMQPKKT